MADWDAIKSAFEGSTQSVSSIGRDHGVSHTAINNRADKEGWHNPRKDAPKTVSKGKVSKKPKPETETVVDAIVDDDGLTDQQRRFVAEYLIDQVATKAYIRAGYSPEGANRNGPRLRAHPAVSAVIDAALRAQIESRVSKADRILSELEAIAFSRVNRVATWANGRVSLKSSEAVDEATLAALSEISETVGEFGVSLKVKLHPKLPALLKLAEREGLFEKGPRPGEEEDVFRDDTFIAPDEDGPPNPIL